MVVCKTCQLNLNQCSYDPLKTAVRMLMFPELFRGLPNEHAVKVVSDYIVAAPNEGIS